jgi:hypothetical protein
MGLPARPASSSRLFLNPNPGNHGTSSTASSKLLLAIHNGRHGKARCAPEGGGAHTSQTSLLGRCGATAAAAAAVAAGPAPASLPGRSTPALPLSPSDAQPVASDASASDASGDAQLCSCAASASPLDAAATAPSGPWPFAGGAGASRAAAPSPPGGGSMPGRTGGRTDPGADAPGARRPAGGSGEAGSIGRRPVGCTRASPAGSPRPAASLSLSRCTSEAAALASPTGPPTALLSGSGGSQGSGFRLAAADPAPSVACSSRGAVGGPVSGQSVAAAPREGRAAAAAGKGR